MQQMWLLPKQAWGKMMWGKKKKNTFRVARFRLNKPEEDLWVFFPGTPAKNYLAQCCSSFYQTFKSHQGLLHPYIAKIFNDNSGSTSSGDAFTLPIRLKRIGHAWNSKAFVDKPFDGVCSVPAGESVAGGQLTHTQLVGQAAVVGAVQTKTGQKVPVKQCNEQHVQCTRLASFKV